MNCIDLYNKAIKGDADAFEALNEMSGNGNYEAQYLLSCVYENTDSPFANLGLAMYWLNTSANYKYEAAMKKIKEISPDIRMKIEKARHFKPGSLLSYNGRIDRSTYASCLLFCLLNNFLFYSQFKQIEVTWYSIILELVIGGILAFLCVAAIVKRLHDCGSSGWWILMPFCPVMLLFAKGEEKDNKYGAKIQ